VQVAWKLASSTMKGVQNVVAEVIRHYEVLVQSISGWSKMAVKVYIKTQSLIKSTLMKEQNWINKLCLKMAVLIILWLLA
jgi:hypothetical protein